MASSLIRQVEDVLGIPTSIADASSNVEFVPTGSLGLDTILGGGLPKGRLLEVYGEESTGKTTLMLKTAANFVRWHERKKREALVVLADTEGTVTEERCHQLGVPEDKLVYLSPDHWEQLFTHISKIVEFSKKKTLDTGILVLLDSVPATLSKAEFEGTFDDQYYAVRARVLSQNLPKLVNNLRNSGTTVVLLNQVRDAIGSMFQKDHTPGGRAIKFFASARISLRRKGTYQDPATKQNVGVQILAKAVKNKVAPPLRESIIPIDFRVGNTLVEEVFEILRADDKKRITSKGAYWQLEGVEKKFFRKNWPTILEENSDTVFEALNISGSKAYRDFYEELTLEQVDSVLEMEDG